jgi:hypothetical protein
VKTVWSACLGSPRTEPRQHAPQHVIVQDEMMKQCRGGMQAGEDDVVATQVRHRHREEAEEQQCLRGP